MESISERILRIIEKNRIKRVKFAEILGITPAYVTHLIQGKNPPSDALIKLICEKFNVEESWLRTGQGEMTAEQLPDNTLAAALDKIITAGPDDFKRRLISVLVQLPEEKWAVLEEIAEEMSRSPQFRKPTPVDEIADFARRSLEQVGLESETSPSPGSNENTG